MSLIDYNFFLSHHVLPSKDVPQTAFNTHVILAEKKLTEWTGSTYSEVEEIDPNTTDKKEQKKLTLFKAAEAELTMYYLIGKLGTRINELGIARSVTSEKMGAGASTSVAGPREIKLIKQTYLDNAADYLSDYIPDTIVVPVSVE